MFELNKKDQPPTAAEDQASTNRDKRPDRPQVQSSEIAVIGRSIKIDGDLRGEENLRIEGDINGTIQLPNHNLTIGKEGRIKADAYAESVIVDGVVDGDLYGSECVTIRASARVKGNIVASRVTLEEGAQFKGSIDMDPESVEAALGNMRKALTSASSAPSLDVSKKASAVATDSSPAKPVSAQNLAGNKTPKVESAH